MLSVFSCAGQWRDAESSGWWGDGEYERDKYGVGVGQHEYANGHFDYTATNGDLHRVEPIANGDDPAANGDDQP
jgi:hypothetical protein